MVLGRMYGGLSIDAHSFMRYHSGVLIHVLAGPVCFEWFSICVICFVGHTECSVMERDCR